MPKRLLTLLIGSTMLLPFTVTAHALSGTPVTVVAVGDIGMLAGEQAETAELTSRIDPDRVLLLGDLAYYTGSSYEFETYFDPYWGVHAGKSWAVPGNHEYGTRYAVGYRLYAQEHNWPLQPNLDAWWSRKIPDSNWVVIGLDSEKATGAPGVRQAKFLRQALKKYPGQPIIVIWHRPRFSKGIHGNTEYMNNLWSIAMSDLDVKMFLWGHDHNYERRSISKKLASGKVHTVQTFVVGTGGAQLRNCPNGSAIPQLQCGTKNNFGVLKLELEDERFGWSFIKIDDQTYDSGTKVIS